MFVCLSLETVDPMHEETQLSQIENGGGLDQILERIHGLVSDPSAPQRPTPPSAPPPPAPAISPATAPPPPPTLASSPKPKFQTEGEALDFGRLTPNRDEPFVPRVPDSLEAAGLSDSLVESLLMRYLLQRGEASGRQIAEQLKLPFLIVEPILNRLKYEQMTAYRGANTVNDYTHSLTERGRDRARQYLLQTTYYGAAPVRLEDYRRAVKLQSVESQNPRREELLHAFRDLLIDRKMLGRIGPAINSGRGMFLYGYPGNGKTSIAERITLAFGKYIWIPRAILVDGDIMRLFDPLMHEEQEVEESSGLLKDNEIDHRWIRIKRPTIIAGGELTMDMLEVQQDRDTNINEAPLQLKSNCGVLVIDDFGRQKMRVDELLNRWIVPLEKRYDFLNMSSGKKTQVPFDQLVIFSTNLQPKDLVDDAFLRRIPYKIEVENPSEAAFRKLFEIMCPKFEMPHKSEVIDYLIQKHYKAKNRPFRNCHPRDLLLQVRNYCLYHDQPLDLTNEYVDFACENYFSIM
jgi:hypothetical protein